MKAYKVQKIEIDLCKQDKLKLDTTSSLCCRLYNYLLKYCKLSYLSNNGSNELLKPYKLSKNIEGIIETFPILNQVNFMLLDNVAYRVRKGLLSIPYNKRFENLNLKEWNKEWFTLQYLRCNQGYKVVNNILTLTLSKNQEINVRLLEKKKILDLLILKLLNRMIDILQIFVILSSYLKR